MYGNWPQFSRKTREISQKSFASQELEGVFIAETKGNQKHFFLNKRYPLYNELKSILFKTVGVEGRLKDIIGKTKGIKLSFIYGSYAANKKTLQATWTF